MVDEHAEHAVLLLQPAVHDQDRLQVRHLAIALIDRRAQDDVDVAELIGQREELEFLAGGGRLTRDHQATDAHFGPIADTLTDRLGVDHA